MIHRSRPGLSHSGFQNATRRFLGGQGIPLQPLFGGGLDLDSHFCHTLRMQSLRQPGSGMISARVGRGRPGGAEKRFLINRMIVLFIGGTGNISESVSRLAISQGMDLHLLNRGKRGVSIPDAKTVTADINDAAAVRSALGKTTYDAVVNWIAFTPTEIERDIALFAGRTAQYIFISSASVYQKPATSYLITESTPLANPYWEYSRNKIACEERLMAEYRANGFPFTTVRPSLTYGARLIPLAINSWGKS